jgi:predicted metal-binding membrane protein
MTSTTLRRTLPPGVTQAGLVAGLLVVAAAGWILTGARMGGMDAGPGTRLGGLGWFIVGWTTMMAAMMLPSTAPTVLAHARVQERNRALGAAAPSSAPGLFVAGYLFSWAVAGMLGYTIIEGVRSLGLGFLAWNQAGSYVAGGVILGAALYQLAPLKDSCLRHCRNPLAFLRRHWRSGRIGALRMGMEHGWFCFGCCWALMAALFAIGVMNVGLMVFVAVLIAAEKLLPWKATANRGIAVLLVVLAVAVAFTPGDVPGLTIPGSPEASRAMEAMGMEPEHGAMGNTKEAMP